MHRVVTRPKARKCHMCLVCYRAIRPGEQYRRCVTFDGEVLTFVCCMDCEEACEEAREADHCDIDGSVTDEGVREWAAENRAYSSAAAALYERINSGRP